MMLGNRFSSTKDELMHIVIRLHELDIYSEHKKELESYYGKAVVQEVETSLESLISRLY